MLNIVTIAIDICLLMVAVPWDWFIIFTMISERVRNKRLGRSEQLICVISAFNCFYYLIKVSRYLNLLLIMHSISIFSKKYKMGEFIFLLTMVSSKLWVSNWLCAYFCLKIVRVNHKFYICLQRLFPKLCPWILIISIFVSFVLSLTEVCLNDEKLLDFPYNQNVSSNTVFQNVNFIAQVYIMFCLAAILIFIILALTIIGSLCRHMNRMKNNLNGTRISNVEAHVQASKTLVILLFTNVIWFNIANLLIIDTPKGLNNVTPPLLTLNTLLSSVNLIRGNNTLKNKLSDILICLSCCSQA
ncbi:hypothetical protein XENTR_v10022169 [Xenopus tropicalis]|uniref:Taste receptor type 2 n=1 Tax=Xenopus tropicalis TaxID=8364 RepID=Q2AB72_XENTR|nr:bitter taste receptor 9 [Xenopus tropicalis]KAE8587899.1 hypothetical protein XENTR_v10022169 [Xenopus tropicalis]BAE80395.1 bitter taste receptor [Xenopus tropicalis]|eukprot:NP_001165472.1 bitter taste receptor 9 [Xenopus tropicalis]